MVLLSLNLQVKSVFFWMNLRAKHEVYLSTDLVCYILLKVIGMLVMFQCLK